MKILLAHNRYQQEGGEDVVVAAERALLAGHGHEVALHLADNETISGMWGKFATAWNAAYSPIARRNFARELARFKPDVVHVHNFFPLLTPSIYDACQEAGVPVVQTLHNYRAICAGALLMRDGNVCELCVHGSPYQAVLHGCYRGSRLASLAVARMVEVHRAHGTWRDKVDRFIALTEFAKSKFVEAGFPEQKIRVKPNFVDALDGPTPPHSVLPVSGENTGAAKGEGRAGALFVGRLSREKGIMTLLQAWQGLAIPLLIVGDGPLRSQMERAATVFMRWAGRLAPHEVVVEMRKAAFLVMPSECYESFGLVIVEAFSNGLPVIASRLGSMAELVEDGVTGLHFTPGDSGDLAAKARWLMGHPDECARMGENARKVYERYYSPQRNYEMLIEIYRESRG